MSDIFTNMDEKKLYALAVTAAHNMAKGNGADIPNVIDEMERLALEGARIKDIAPDKNT